MEFWNTLSALMTSCRSYQELAELCWREAHRMPPLFQANMSNVRLVKDCPDTTSTAWIPSDCPMAMPFPVSTTGDGSCFAHAAARLIFGTEARSLEMRMRLVVEGVINSDKYLNDAYLRFGAEVDDDFNVLQWYSTLSGAYSQQQLPPAEVYMREVYNFRELGVEASQWQFHQLASLLGRPVVSMFPMNQAFMDGRRDFINIRAAYNRVILPWHEMRDVRDSPPIAIMWTSASSTATPLTNSPNHFVSVVP